MYSKIIYCLTIHLCKKKKNKKSTIYNLFSKANVSKVILPNIDLNF